MSRTFSALPASLAVCLCLLAPVAAQVLPGDLSQFVLTDRDAYLLDTPVPVALGAVDTAVWSPDGKFVLARRNRIDPKGGPAETALHLWSAETQKSREIWKARGLAQVDWFDWLPGSDVAVAMVIKTAPPPQAGANGAAPEPQKWVVRIDARRGTAQPLLQVPLSTEADRSPTRPLVRLSSYERLLAVLGPDGAVKDLTRALPARIDGSPRWGEDGIGLWIRGAPQPAAGQKARYGWYVLDPQTLKLSGPVQGNPPEDPREQAEAVGRFRLKHETAPLAQAETRRVVRPLWIESTAPSELSLALVTANCTGAPILSPRHDAVLYLGEGGAWVRPLVRFDKAVFLEARDAARRTLLMSNARQLGTGLLIYAEEHDEQLPAAGADLHTLLLPTIKHASLFEDFTYTYAGGKLADIPEPANTVLGYTPAPGGRVWLYVDGHVKFIKE